jgi:DNA-binding transcriptional LysR family regulator
VPVHLDLLRSFLTVVEHGSLNQAAERLHVAQSTLTRQIQALEHHVGGRLFERTATGVALTAAGRTFHEGVRPVLAALEQVLDDTRRQVRGESARLRIGCLMSLVGELLHPALAAFRRAHPEVKVRLADLSPGEQIEALRRGELDLALFGGTGSFVAREFHLRRLATFPVLAVLGETHPFAQQVEVHLKDLARESFVGARERDLPGYNAWMAKLCRRAGFRPRVVIETDSLTHGLAAVVIEGAVALFPSYTRPAAGSGVVYRPLRDRGATWDLFAAWPRGKTPAPVRTMLEALPGLAEAATRR